MRNKLLEILHFLERNNIPYYLLRPIDCLDFSDVDLIIPKNAFCRLLNLLQKSSYKVYIKQTNANESIQLFINDVLLDIKFSVCFLPRKILVFKSKLEYSSYKIEKNQFLFPEVKDEVLFTFWTFHLFLDKDSPSSSSSFIEYKKRYHKKWDEMMTSSFFKSWLKNIFVNDVSIVLADKLLRVFFSEGMNVNSRLGARLRSEVFKNRMHLIFSFYFSKYKFKLKRFLGIYRKQYSIEEILKLSCNEI